MKDRETEMPNTLTIDLEQGGILRIRLNRPERLNAINDGLMSELTAALSDAGNEIEVRCIVLTGTGRAFCAGGDVSNMGSRTAEETMTRVTRLAAGLMTTLAEVPKPVIAAVNGPALGGGLSLALACDVVLVHERAFFAVSYTDRGLVPDMGLTFFLPRLLGLQRAKELVLTGRRVYAEEAVTIGLAAGVLGDAEFESGVQSAAAELAARPTLALGMTKRLLNRAFESDLVAMLESEGLAQGVSVTSEDHKAAVRAFVAQQKEKTDKSSQPT
jgi:2-(1,2-epoxy-1,2-dihydrophenyl)acetyl-CoA isomerase